MQDSVGKFKAYHCKSKSLQVLNDIRGIKPTMVIMFLNKNLKKRRTNLHYETYLDTHFEHIPNISSRCDMTLK